MRSEAKSARASQKKRWASEHAQDSYQRQKKRRIADNRLMRTGWTQAEYDEALKAQNGVCAICGKSPEQNGKALAADHRHDTGHKRGLLCANCNAALGMLNEDLDLFSSAVDYLKSWRWIEDQP